jgi:protein-S-isoprenylcysteine O-methyltransferase Ste14
MAVAYGAACHGLFAAAIGAMVLALATGLQGGAGHARGGYALVANGLLLLQFPLLHSALLTRRGRRILIALAPERFGATLAPTTYALIASAQLLAVFTLWTPSGVVWWQAQGVLYWAIQAVNASAWLFVARAIWDASLGLQTGFIGWRAVFTGRPLKYPPFPDWGLFARCRQPIYFGFAMTLWIGPVWTPDHLAIALVWTLYCVIAPLHKEQRYLRIYGEAFAAYRRRVRYLVPSVFS